MIGIHIPQINMINVTIYRPPHCPMNFFMEIIDKLENWIKSIEDSGDRPIVSINGDFNLPFMNNWDEVTITELLETCETRSSKGNTISSDKSQAIRLIDMINNQFLHQVIDSSTRINNLV